MDKEIIRLFDKFMAERQFYLADYRRMEINVAHNDSDLGRFARVAWERMDARKCGDGLRAKYVAFLGVLAGYWETGHE